MGGSKLFINFINIHKLLTHLRYFRSFAMSSKKLNSKVIYEVTRQFTHYSTNWKPFARDYLKLKEYEISDIEQDYDKQGRQEQKYQMVIKWEMKNGSLATEKRLRDLVEEYWKAERDGNDEESVSSSVVANIAEPSGDTNSNQPVPKNCMLSKMLPEEQPAMSPGTYDNDENDEQLNLNCDATQSQQVKATAVLETEEKLPLKQLLGPFLGKSKITKNGSGDAANDCERVEEIRVLPCDEKTYKSIVKKKDHYPIDSFYTKGCVLIMNNSFNGNKDWKRPGSELDVRHMRELWEGLGCKPKKVIIKENEPAAEMEKILKSFAEKLNRKYNFIVVVIMSHGEKDGNGKQVFLGADMMPVEVDFVLDLFNNENAKHLQNIPKLFFFQFCRGDNTDKGVVSVQRDGESVAEDDNFDFFKQYLTRKFAKQGSGCVEKDGPGAQANLLPTCSDQLVAYATHDRFAAIRHPDNGSLFINAVTNIFMKNARDEHVLDLLTKVNKAVKEKTGVIKLKDGSMSPCKEMSNFESNLTEKLYLLPGYPLNDEDIEGI